MELIERIRRAEKQAEEIRRAGEAEAERILKGARSNAEVLLMLSKKTPHGTDRRETERLAALREEWRQNAEKNALDERKNAEKRLSDAVSYIVSGIRKSAL